MTDDEVNECVYEHWFQRHPHRSGMISLMEFAPQPDHRREASMGWQPISTAPDEVVVLGHIEGDGEPYITTIVKIRGRWMSNQTIGEISGCPNYWMPLPLPPSHRTPRLPMKHKEIVMSVSGKSAFETGPSAADSTAGELADRLRWNAENSHKASRLNMAIDQSMAAAEIERLRDGIETARKRFEILAIDRNHPAVSPKVGYAELTDLLKSAPPTS